MRKRLPSNESQQPNKETKDPLDPLVWQMSKLTYSQDEIEDLFEAVLQGSNVKPLQKALEQIQLSCLSPKLTSRQVYLAICCDIMTMDYVKLHHFIVRQSQDVKECFYEFIRSAIQHDMETYCRCWSEVCNRLINGVIAGNLVGKQSIETNKQRPSLIQQTPSDHIYNSQRNAVLIKLLSKAQLSYLLKSFSSNYTRFSLQKIGKLRPYTTRQQVKEAGYIVDDDIWIKARKK